MFWIIVWVLALIIFLIIPICCSTKRRNELFNRIRKFFGLEPVIVRVEDDEYQDQDLRRRQQQRR